MSNLNPLLAPRRYLHKPGSQGEMMFFVRPKLDIDVDVKSLVSLYLQFRLRDHHNGLMEESCWAQPSLEGLLR